MRYSDVRWRKSSRSGEQGNCVEVGAWRKSSHSTDQGHCVEVGTWQTSSHSADEGNCVEIAADAALALARDSKDPDGPVLGFGTDAWTAFLETVKSGSLDLT